MSDYKNDIAPIGREPFLKYLQLLRERVPSFDKYPFSIPAIRDLGQIDIHPQVTFFVGENGSGKSTLLEAIAVLQGMNAEGGGLNFDFSTRASHSELGEFLRAGRGLRMLRKADAFFFRAESFYNLATKVDDLGVAGFYGGKSLHEQSHGESFFSLMRNRFWGNGLYLLDEPESALSPSRQLSMLRIMRDLIAEGSQFIIATHSPILLGYPESMIYSFSEIGITSIEYEATEHYKVTKSFLIRREAILKELFEDSEATSEQAET